MHEGEKKQIQVWVYPGFFFLLSHANGDLPGFCFVLLLVCLVLSFFHSISFDARHRSHRTLGIQMCLTLSVGFFLHACRVPSRGGPEGGCHLKEFHRAGVHLRAGLRPFGFVVLLMLGPACALIYLFSFRVVHMVCRFILDYVTSRQRFRRIWVLKLDSACR